MFLSLRYLCHGVALQTIIYKETKCHDLYNLIISDNLVHFVGSNRMEIFWEPNGCGEIVYMWRRKFWDRI
jgi:hypothetical protein